MVQDKKPWPWFKDKEALVILPWDVPISAFFHTVLVQLRPLPVVSKQLFMWLCSKPHQELPVVKTVNKKACKIERVLFFFLFCVCVLVWVLFLHFASARSVPDQHCPQEQSGPAERPECCVAGGRLAGVDGGNSVTALPPKSANQETIAGKTLLHSAAKQNSCCVSRSKKKKGMLLGYRVCSQGWRTNWGKDLGSGYRSLMDEERLRKQYQASGVSHLLCWNLISILDISWRFSQI